MITITTHILDTSLGRPAENVSIELQRLTTENLENAPAWQAIAKGSTNKDGRISDLVAKIEAQNFSLSEGIYKMVFYTGDYYATLKTKTFYPKVEIIFEIFDHSHYHIPLLINPFGYSTYRGS
jgi:hydroxyisourate hydrolase